MADVYLESQSISTHYLGVIGYVVNGFIWPCHCRVYWNDAAGQWWMTELADTPEFPNFSIAGKGDGYRIYIYKVPAPAGAKVGTCDPAGIEKAARAYASTENGDLWYPGPGRKWHPQPQGHGGPMYDACTSNTYARWVLQQAGLAFAKPKGGHRMGIEAAVPGTVLDYMDGVVTLYRVTLTFTQSYKYESPPIAQGQGEPHPPEYLWVKGGFSGFSNEKAINEASSRVGYDSMVMAASGKEAYDKLVAYLTGPHLKKTLENSKHGESKVFDLDRKDFEFGTIEALPWGRLLLNDHRKTKEDC